MVVGLGITFVFPFLQAFAERRGVGSTRFALQFSEHLGKWVVAPGGALVGLFGLGLIFDDTLAYSENMPGWLWASIVWYVLAYGASLTIMKKTTAAALSALDGVPDDGEFPAEYTSVAKRAQMIGGLLGLSIIGIAFLMTTKP